MSFTLLELFSKLLIYSGASFILGGLFILILQKHSASQSLFNLQYILTGCIISFIGGTVNFFAKVGDIAEEGFAGMWDPTFIEILSTSSVGESTNLRFNALLFVILGVALYGIYDRFAKNKNNTLRLFLLVPALTGALLLTLSFALIGHSVDDPFAIRFLLVIHVFLALLWMGSLIPLWKSCKTLSVNTLRTFMHQFGQIAISLVIILLICGIAVAIQLLENIEELFTTRYGLLLTAKLFLVTIILGMAAWHRIYLVPQLKAENRTKYLQGSIVLEILTGFEILVVTVLLSTIIGPGVMS